MTREKILELIEAELKRAKKLHPRWPQGWLRQTAVIAEEAGEALQGANSYAEYWEQATAPEVPIIDELENNIIKEVIETGAMVFRFLENIE